MKLYSSNENYKLYHGNMLDMLEVIEKESIDSIVTDPPYGLTSITKRFGKENSAECQYGKDGSFQRLSKGFMGKEWDGSGIEYNVETWKKCYEVLKPGGYLLAFGGSRTFHRIAVAIEDAGFEIRDTIMWLYGSGFPKSLNISKTLEKREGMIEETTGTLFNNPGGKRDLSKRSDYGYIYEPQLYLAKQWQGWGTALKPSFEPIIVARKPFKGSLVDNVIEYGVGGINIDECRVKFIENENTLRPTGNKQYFGLSPNVNIIGGSEMGRFPANTILTYDETDFDEVCGGFPNNTASYRKGNRDSRKAMFDFGSQDKTNQGYTDNGSASRYFYTAKASKKDRDEGLDEFEDGNITDGRKAISDRPYLRKETLRKNTHPTVKPTDLMQYLVRLVTPNNGTILDPFNGSGSTGKAVMYENKERNKNYKYIGIELTEEYLPISKARIEYVCNLKAEINPQMSIFDFDEK